MIKEQNKISIHSIVLITFLHIMQQSAVANDEFSAIFLANYVEKNPLVLDAKNRFSYPRRFRTTSMSVPKNKLFQFLRIKGTLPSFEGYYELRASGSAQFSKNNILAALSSMKGRVYIVDLRQESHGFINGEAVSWYGERNWGNEGHINSLVSILENKLLEQLILLEQINICNLKKVLHKPYCTGKPNAVIVKNANTEEGLIKSLGLNYIRFPVLDRWRPQDEIIDSFVEFIKSLPDNAWLHFHCRGGSGRTTTFLIMYDIIRNGNKVSLNDIIARHALTGVKDISSYSMKYEWIANGAKQRLAVIEQFYAYVIDPEGYKECSWSEWLKMKQEQFTS